MKKLIYSSRLIILSIAIGISTNEVLSQGAPKNTNSSEAKRSYFVFIYTQGEAWIKGKPLNEQRLDGHFAYMMKLQGEKRLIAGGPFKDDSGAMGIFEATNLKEAEEIVNNDPIVKNRLVNAKVHPWLPAVLGCIENK